MIKERVYILIIVLASMCLPVCSQVYIDASELTDSVLLNDSLANYYGEKGELSKAQEYASKNVAINRAVSGENSVLFAIALLKLARYLYPNDREIDNKMSKEGLSILKDSLGVKTSTYTKYLLEYAWRQFNLGQVQEACNTIKDAAEEKYDNGDFYLGYLYFSYAHFLKELEDENNALKFAKMAKLFFEEQEMYSNDYYPKTLIDLAYLSAPNHDVSLSYLTKAKKVIEKTKGKDCIDYLDVLLKIAYFFRATGQLEEALDYAIQAEEIGEKIKQIDYGSYLYTLEFLAGRYSSLGQYNEAIKYAENCLNLMKESKEIALEDRLPTLDSLVVYYSAIHNIDKINLYAKEAYLIRKNYNITDENMAKSLFYLLHSSYSLLKYEDCEVIVKELKELYGDSFSSNYKHYYDDMEILMQSFFKRRLYKEALEVSDEIRTTYMDQYGEDNEYLASIYFNQANIYTYLGETVKYHDYTIKALEIIRKSSGGGSPKYLSYLSTAANNFFNMGLFNEAYDLFKEASSLADNLYGKMHILYITNYLSAMTLWDRKMEEFYDDYNLEDLYRCLLFQRCVYGINNIKQERFERMMNSQYHFIKSSLPNLLYKYKDTLSINAIYNCLLLSKLKVENPEQIISQVSSELGKESNKRFLEYCKTNSAYTNAQFNSTPELLDSLYREANHLITLFSKESITFRNFIKEMVTVDTLRNNLKDKELIIDYIPQKHLGTRYVDYLVFLDNKKLCPDFVPVTNAQEQIKQLIKSYSTIYYLIDNDSVLLNLNLDKNYNSIIGYKTSIAHILNRGRIKISLPQDFNNHIDHTDVFASAIRVFEKGVNLYNMKQYKNAIEAFSQCDSLMYLSKGDESCFFGHGMQWIASCYYKMGNDSIARQLSNYYNLTPIDMRFTILSDSILDVAESLYLNGEIEASLKKFIEASEEEKRRLGRYSYWYANTLSHCADLYKELGEYEKAIEFEKEAMNIRKKSPGINHIDYYYSLKNLFLLNLEIGNKTNLISFGEMLIGFTEKHKEILGINILDYPLYTSILAKTYAEENSHNKSFSFCEKTIESAELWVESPESYTSLFHGIIITLKILKEDSIAFELCKQIIPFYEKDKKLQLKEHDNYVDILNTIANHYNNNGDFISTCIYQEKVIDILKDKSAPIYGTTLSNLALTYCELGRLEEAIKNAEESVRLSENDTLLMMDSRGKGIYATRLTNLAHCYAIANKPKEALRIGKKSYAILMDEFGLDNDQTMVAANNLASYYDELGYVDESKKLLLSVVDYAQKDMNKYGDILGTVYNNLGMMRSRKQLDFKVSLKYINKSYEIRKNVLGEYNLYTIQSLYNKGRCLLDIGEISEGISCITEALSQTKDLIGENNFRYVEMMKILIPVYAKGGNLDRALSIAEKRVELLNKIVGEYHLSYLKSIEELSELHFYRNDTVNLYSRIIEESNKYRKMVISDFPNYTSIERENAVNGMGRFFDWLFPLVCYYKNQPQTRSELYNALLLRKGLLLNSEIEFGLLIRESGDSALVRRYNDLIANKKVLNKQYQLPVEHRTFDVDSLKLKINEEEDDLVIASKDFGEFTKRFNISWEDIKGQLNEDELCVEFVMFDDTCSIHNRIYYALLVEKNCENPRLVPLCNENQIQIALRDEGKAGEIYKLVWEPIICNSNNAQTIYFSPCGILNSIGIEYVDINENENITEKYNLHRLSSTREIIKRTNSICKSATLYGGLEYAVSTDVLLAQNKINDGVANTSVMYRGLSDSLSVRNSFEPLYNTKSEISEIGKTLKSGEVSVSMYSETYGTEESFKELSGKGQNLIHLATHGMYIGTSEAESKKKESNLSFIQIDDTDKGVIQEDMSLTRSFLVMSGGDMLPSHKSIPDNLEDGILTAYEISKLDLRGLDLVVLSACQTALGDVDYEGVYGLQRGFKKAGANTILMSLDKVDDEATKFLMVEFYRNLMSGKTKHQSLKNAQNHLRKIDNGKYDDPKYWASFIMLDGLN